MNVKHNTFEIFCDGNQVYEAVSSLLHTVLFHRTLGKFNYTDDTSYSIGTVGFEEITCDFIDFTYIRSASPHFIESVNREVREFVDRLRLDSNQIGSVCLEFYSKKRKNWTFNDDVLKWEIWTIRIGCVGGNRTRVEEVLMDKVLNIIQVVNNSNSYLPPMPSERFLSTVFDTSFQDVQPYLHKIGYRIENSVHPHLSPITSDRPPVTTALRDMVMDTLFKF